MENQVLDQKNDQVSTLEGDLQPAIIDQAIKTKSSSKILAILSILLITVTGLAIVFGYQYYQSTQKPTSIPAPQPAQVSPALIPTEIVSNQNEGQKQSAPNEENIGGWKTHTSEKLGISFDYPSDYTPPEEIDGYTNAEGENDYYLQLYSPSNHGSEYIRQVENGELKIEIFTEPIANDNSPLKCWQDHSADGSEPTKQTDIEIGGIKTLIFDWEEMGTGQFICVTHNNWRYLINKYPAKTSRDGEFERLVSSFRFTR